MSHGLSHKAKAPAFVPHPHHISYNFPLEATSNDGYISRYRRGRRISWPQRSSYRAG